MDKQLYQIIKELCAATVALSDAMKQLEEYATKQETMTAANLAKKLETLKLG